MAGDQGGSKPEKKAPRLGATGDAVRRNVRRLRDAQGLSAADVSKRLDTLGRPIPLVGIQRIESGERRPDADDLVALAVVLGVSPSTLLMPSGVAAEDVVSASSIEVEAALLWDWLIARRPLPDESGPLLYERAAIRFFDRALPPWESITIEAGVLGSGEPSEFMKRTLLRKFYPDGVPDGDD